MKPNTYSNIWKKIRPYVILWVFIYVLLKLISIWSGEPKYLKESELFLHHNESVVMQLGEIQTIKLYKTLTFQSDGKTPDYQEFRFIVRAKKKDAMVTVRVQAVSQSDPTPNYSVVSVEPK